MSNEPPKTDEEIEAMLDEIDAPPMSEEKLQRMLGKINGTIPMSWEDDHGG